MKQVTYQPAACKTFGKMPANTARRIVGEIDAYAANSAAHPEKGHTMNDMITIPKDEYNRLVSAVEDLEDMRALDEYRANPGESVPVDFINRMLDGESPLRLWRDHRGLTQQALADTAAVNRVMIAQIEKGTKPGSVETLAKLAGTLKITIDDLVA